MDKEYYNASGYPDPTAYHALQRTMTEEKKASFLIKMLKFIINESGFELLSRIEIRNKKSGTIYR